MSALARIRKTALQHEQERQYDKALALYARLLDGAEAGEEEVDVGLFNRAGDLALRLNDTPRAIGYFERALDQYAAGGLLNNAVALGVKILRHAPNHLSAHYTLGVLYGRKGFAGDARHHLLTYAVQMQRAGRPDEAARVLGEVAGACTDAADRRAAVDAYGALGGDAAQAGALAAEPAAAAVAQPVLVAEAPTSVTWGVVDLEPTVFEPAAEEAVAAQPFALESASLLLPDVDEFVPPPDEPAWGALELMPSAELDLLVDPTTDDSLSVEGTSAGPGLVFLNIGDESDVGTVEPIALEGAALSPAATWDQALPGEPPALRLAELLRVDDALPAAAEASVFVAPTGDDASGSNAITGAPAIGATTFAGADTLDLALEAALELPPVRYADPLLVELADVASEAARSDEPSTAEAAPPERSALDADTHAPLVREPVAVTQATTASEPDDLLDLGAWLRENTPEPSTRMTTASVPQTGDEQADFDATLRAFTSGVARAVDHEDFDSHYDLGVAFREMGLLEEAVVEFQRAARVPGGSLRAYEAMAQCFLDLRQPEVALRTLEGPSIAAAAEGVGDASLVGVHYLMGAAAQALGRADDARRWFVRVVATDVRFRDAAARLAALPPPSPVR